MFTICPQCSTVFAIEAGHLRKAGGQVRCGECYLVFSAIDFLYQDLAAAREALLEMAQVDTPVETGVEQYAFESMEGAGDEPTAVDAGAEPASEVEDTPPVFEVLDETDSKLHPGMAGVSGHWSDSTVSWKDFASGAVIGLLFLLFGVQWVFFNRAALAADSGWRPTLERFCSILHCDLPLQSDVSHIELLDRDVRKHPLAEEALLVNATLVNHAGFTQPYPVFSIGFSDLSGKLVAARRFSPREYLGEGADIAAGMAADSPVHVVLEIQDPGEMAVSFQFEFL